jgi:RNA polymerase sigma-70 factor (ECF subfamily)
MSSVSSAPLDSGVGGANDACVPPRDKATTFNDLYAENFPFVWRNARHLAGGDGNVDDVVQEVFLVALRKLPEFEGRASLKSWLYAILRRVASDHRRSIRRRNVRDSVDLEELEAKDSGPHRKVEKTEAKNLLREMLDKLDENKREAFVLAEFEKMTMQQIAEAVGVNATTVAARLRDARRELSIMAERHRRRTEGRGRAPNDGGTP